jgi:hypothetical protein
MAKSLLTKREIVEAIKEVARSLGKTPPRSYFMQKSGITEYQVLKYFSSWNEAVQAAGLDPETKFLGIQDDDLLSNWGGIVRQNQKIPTRAQYRRQGNYSPGVFEKHFGPWSNLPSVFRTWAEEKTEWGDVLSLLPDSVSKNEKAKRHERKAETENNHRPISPLHTVATIDGRPTYGDPIDFRGLRHQPVNEQGVVFLFGMVARELGYLVGAADRPGKVATGSNRI